MFSPTHAGQKLSNNKKENGHSRCTGRPGRSASQVFDPEFWIEINATPGRFSSSNFDFQGDEREELRSSPGLQVSVAASRHNSTAFMDSWYFFSKSPSSATCW